jgi:oligopeptide/dipeptide ABC transporter ATP-binding protein
MFKGKDLVTLPWDEMHAIRGNDISMIFQEPMTSLNPVYTVGDQIVEGLLLHTDMSEEQAWDHAEDMLRKVGIPAPEMRINDYPHQMSGGMKQRVMIAMALATNPQLLIADEPTTALDVTIRAQIMELLRELQKEMGMSILLITHDLGVVAESAHRVVVMYASKVVERAEVKELFGRPRHPYTVGLFNSIPNVALEEDRLKPVKGQVPVPLRFPEGCKFHPRCDHVMDVCRTEEPPLTEVGDRHWARCWLNDEEKNPKGWPV